MKVRGWVIYLPFRVMHFFKKQTSPPSFPETHRPAQYQHTADV